jgi:hypothetical protein
MPWLLGMHSVMSLDKKQRSLSETLAKYVINSYISPEKNLFFVQLLLNEDSRVTEEGVGGHPISL